MDDNTRLDWVLRCAQNDEIITLTGFLTSFGMTVKHRHPEREA
ncbi:hypothetical protein [Fibrobacter sp. UWB3]|nr:hypothetical protein [Fibrobacter sp. UWB3]